MKRRPIFPHSLRQLVMLALSSIPPPLLALAWQAWQSLNVFNDQAASINRTTLIDTRRNEAMINAALEMERNYRQYCMLDDPTPVKVYQNQRKRYSEIFGAHAGVLSDDKLHWALCQDLNNLVQLQCDNNGPDAATAACLEVFASANTEMVQATRVVVFSRGQRFQREITEHGQHFDQQSLVLFLVSLVMVLLFTWIIIGPVKNIERMINRPEEGRSLGNSTSFSRPSELRSVEQCILWSSERLSWLESQYHQFLRHSPHELKAPLASIHEGTELLADQVVGPFAPEQKEVVSILDNNSRSLQKLIEQPPDHNRKQADNAVELGNVELASLIKTAVSAHGLSARAKMMHTDIDLKTIVYLAKLMLLMNVLDNLRSNAVHYGAESGSICFRSSSHGARVYIDIINTGTPIPQEERAMIFEPFFQGSHQRKGAVKGSDPGLSTARDCTHRMQEGLYLVDEGGQDACFRIESPSSKNTK